MKNQVKLGLLAGGILASFVALAPLTAYAVSVTSNPNPTVTVTVNPVLTLDSATSASLTADSSQVVDTTFNVKVTANKGYTISLHAPESTALTATGDISDSIPAASTLTAGTNGWGIKKKSADNSADDANDYTAITGSAVQFYKSTSGTIAAGVTTTFTVGVAIAPTLTAGSYSTNITVTAATI